MGRSAAAALAALGLGAAHEVVVYEYVADKLSFAEAEANCAAKGGKIADVDDPTTLAQIYQEYVPSTSCAPAWIDAVDEEAEAAAARAEEIAEQLCLMDVEEYAADDCAYIGRKCVYGHEDIPPWGNDVSMVNCNAGIPSICEYPPATDNHDHLPRRTRDALERPPPDVARVRRSLVVVDGHDDRAPRSLEDDCPEGWLSYGGRCYQAVGNNQYFSQCLETCACAGGTLACPRDKGTNTFLKNMVKPPKNRAWLGVSDAFSDKDGSWQCVGDGELNRLTYTNWDNSLGNGMDRGANCASMDEDGTWDDDSCNGDYNNDDYSCLCEHGGETAERFVYHFAEQLIELNEWQDWRFTADGESKVWPCCATCQNGCGGAGSDECMDAAHSAVIDGVAYGVCDSNGVTPYDGQPCQRECEEARSWSDFEFEEVRLMPRGSPCGPGWALPGTAESCRSALALVGRSMQTAGPLAGSAPTCAWSLADGSAGAFLRDTTCDEATAADWDRGAVCVPCDDCDGVGSRCARLRVDDPQKYAYASAADDASAGSSKKDGGQTCNLHCLLLVGVIFMLVLLTTCTCIGNYFLTKERRKFSPTRGNRIPNAVWSDVELQDAHAIPAEALEVGSVQMVGRGGYVAATAADPADTASDAAIAAAVGRIDAACDRSGDDPEAGALKADGVEVDDGGAPMPPVADVAPVVASEVSGAEICI